MNSNGGQVVITPISKLRRGVRNLTVRARVISKGTVRHIFQDRMMKIEIYDGSLSFSTLVQFVCTECEAYYNQIEIGKIYVFSKAQIISDQQKGLQRNSLKYEIYDPSYITPVDIELPSDRISANFKLYEFIKLNQINDKHNIFHFDVLGIVMEEPTREKTMDSTGTVELDTMKFIIGDESKNTLQISIRNEYGFTLNPKVFDVVLIKSTHINIYNNMKSADSGSGILLNPYIPEAIALLVMFERATQEIEIRSSRPSFQRKSVDNMKQQQSESNIYKNKEFTQIGDNRISQHCYEVRPINSVVTQVDEQLERVIGLSKEVLSTSEEFLKEFNKTFYSEIEGQIYSATAEKKPYYVACSVCNKKLESYPIITTCQKKCKLAVPVARMTTTFNIADATGAISPVAFNDQCMEIFGFDGDFLRILDEMQKADMYHKRDPTYRDFIRMSFNAHYRFRIVSGIQIYEKKYQAKHNIILKLVSNLLFSNEDDVCQVVITKLLESFTFSEDSQWCIKLTISKTIGIGITFLSAIIKIPQMYKIITQKSAKGIAIPTLMIETLFTIVGIANSVLNKLPLSLYREKYGQVIQNIMILILLLFFTDKKSRKALAMLIGIFAFSLALFSVYIEIIPVIIVELMSFALPLSIFGKLIQIWENYQNGSTGNLSLITYGITWLGIASRIWTIFVEGYHFGSVVISAIALVAQGIIVLQIINSQRLDRKIQQRNEKKRQ